MRILALIAVLALAFSLAGCGGAVAVPPTGESAPASGFAAANPPDAPPQRAFHFSVDDVISVFVDLHFLQEDYQSIFNQPTLAFLKRMHDEYGMVSTLYCFYESYDGGFDLSQCTARYAEEFAQNASWLRVGFHARKPEGFFSDSSPQQAAQDYRDMMAALKRICGEAAIDPVARLHWWDASEPQLGAMAAEGLRGLLAGRRPSDGNYHLPPEKVETLFAQDFLPGPQGLFYTPTDLWLEDEKDLDATLAALAAPDAPGLASGLVVAFTHEYAMGDAAMHEKIEQCAQFAMDNQLAFAFPLEFWSESGPAAQGQPAN